MVMILRLVGAYDAGEEIAAHIKSQPICLQDQSGASQLPYRPECGDGHSDEDDSAEQQRGHFVAQ